LLSGEAFSPSNAVDTMNLACQLEIQIGRMHGIQGRGLGGQQMGMGVGIGKLKVKVKRSGLEIWLMTPSDMIII
jgi:hypothetical protein